MSEWEGVKVAEGVERVVVSEEEGVTVGLAVWGTVPLGEGRGMTVARGSFEKNRRCSRCPRSGTSPSTGAQRDQRTPWCGRRQQGCARGCRKSDRRLRKRRSRGNATDNSGRVSSGGNRGVRAREIRHGGSMATQIAELSRGQLRRIENA